MNGQPDQRRHPHWAWWVCVLLLCASAINYMDRQTLANAAVRITKEFGLNNEQYGQLEAGFGWAFAVGSLVFGLLSDRLPLRWLYAGVLTMWSAVGFATAFCWDFHSLLLCRVSLGFFEAGHWPCGVKTARALLDPSRRAMGNSLLQSGTSIGAIITPLLMRWMMTDDLGSWRPPFRVIGALGLLWLAAWLILVRPGDLRHVPDKSGSSSAQRWTEVIFSRRMLLIMAVVALINTAWQPLRSWLPKFLQEGRGYTEGESLYFIASWYGFTDVGCLGAGALALWLARRGWPTRSSRLSVFFLCSALSMSALLVLALAKGPALLAVLLLVGAGVLGVFPIYYAFTQDLSGRHQGKVVGVAGVSAWAFTPVANILFGRHIDATKSFDEGLAIAGCLPMIAALLLLFFWGRDHSPDEASGK